MITTEPSSFGPSSGMTPTYSIQKVRTVIDPVIIIPSHGHSRPGKHHSPSMTHVHRRKVKAHPIRVNHYTSSFATNSYPREKRLEKLEEKGLEEKRLEEKRLITLERHLVRNPAPAFHMPADESSIYNKKRGSVVVSEKYEDELRTPAVILDRRSLTLPQVDKYEDFQPRVQQDLGYWASPVNTNPLFPRSRESSEGYTTVSGVKLQSSKRCC